MPLSRERAHLDFNWARRGRAARRLQPLL